MLQMTVIFSGLLIAGILVVKLLPENIGFGKALQIAGKMGRTNAIDFSFDWNNQYTVWSGLIGGFFLQLSYFGTDQSQVGRYLTGSSIGQSRLGLLMNGLVKIPMQFLILLIGVLVFTFYQYQQPPIFFNSYELGKLERSAYSADLQKIKNDYSDAFSEKQKEIKHLELALDAKDEKAINSQRSILEAADKKTKGIRQQAVDLMKKNDPEAETNDNNYVFLSFVTKYLPQGLIGLLIAIIFLASMGSTASALNSLASTTVVDIYKRLINQNASDAKYLSVSRWLTIAWGILSVLMALYASKMGNLLEAVNILGSLFYGTILGIFLVAFYLKKIGGSATFIAAIITEVIIFSLWMMETMAFLWLNVVGCTLVILIAILLQRFQKKALERPAF
jgi:Na+/proline symporter